MSNINNNLTPKEIVSFLDRYVIGQRDAKKTIAVALRNRYRRMQLSPELQQDVMPKNILMIGNTGVGKTWKIWLRKGTSFPKDWIEGLNLFLLHGVGRALRLKLLPGKFGDLVGERKIGSDGRLLDLKEEFLGQF